nr:spore coat associated protein CotJA [uncultured Butyricicoccus sp.]
MYYDPLAPRGQTTTRECDNLPPVNDEDGNQNGGSDNNGNNPSTPDVTPPLQPEQPLPPQDNENSSGNLPADSIDPKLLSLAMGFVPYQSWGTPYAVDVGFSRGTIFPGLDKPFLGEPPINSTPLRWGV